MSVGKQYGLILPKKGSNQDVVQRPSIFDEDSDSEGSGQGEKDWRKKAYKSDVKSTEKRQTKIQIEKALNEDPSIYQYDEVYDKIKDSSSQATAKKDDRKPSRYIQSLKRNAEKRKLENERRMERLNLKEREKEGEEFKDKETFVTSAYKKKLEEFQKAEEEEKRMDRLEDIGDVTKQKDMSGFYRHLYRSTVDKEQPSNSKDLVVKKEPEVKETAKRESPKKDTTITESKTKQQRQYRKRTKSASSKEEGENTTSSSSSESSSEESDNDQKVDVTKSKTADQKRSTVEVPEKKKRSVSPTKESTESPIKDKKSLLKTADKTGKNETASEGGNLVKDEKPTIKPKEPKPFVDIWLKRTVGNTFDDALQRYMERKSTRQSGY